ncbi:TIGR04388 family protein [Leptospira yasudae]|uniref:TIGR04388 family protein n=1 Tax=Leptospira yasudae TaxID=2202201 RepID=UPI0010914ECE|nr:TIGR04388 family protein [Leptospira yasudae]TGM98339.1 TIGR04388 family protein [Leptospira yasudae]
MEEEGSEKISVFHTFRIRKQKLVCRRIKKSQNSFDAEGCEEDDSLIKTSLGNVDKYFSKDNMDKLSASLFANANGADAKDSRMASIASNSAQSQSQIAGLAVDLIKSVALGGMSPQAWAQSQVKQMAKSAIATVVSKTFNLSPETAALLSGAFLDKQASDKAKQELGMTGPMLSMNRLEGVTRSLAGAMYAPFAEASGYILNASARTLGSAGVLNDSQVRNFQKESRGQIDTLKMRDQKEAVKAYEEDKIQITGQLVKEIGRSGEWSPEVINQLSNAAMSWQRSNDAKESLGYKGNTLEKIAGTFKTIGSTVVGWAGELQNGIGSFVSHGLRGLGVISHDDLEAFNDQSRDIVNDIKLKDEKDAIKQFDEDKLNTYGLGLKQLGIANGMSAQDAEKLSQSFISWQKSNEAKETLGFKGSSLNNIAGFVTNTLSSIAGLAGEFYSGVGSVVAHGLNGLGVMSDQDLIAFNDTIRTTVNDIKMKDEKDAIRNWDAQEIQNYGFAVEQFGKASGMSPDLISQLSKAAVQYATREQAKSALEKHQNFMGGLEAVIAPGMLLDKFLFKDGIVGMLAKGVKGMITTAGDIGKELGLVSDNQLDNLYKQSKVWSNSVTADDLKAKTQEGIVSMYEFQRNAARDMMFTEIGKILSPAFGGMEPQQVGQVLKYYQDQKTAKEAAKDQRIKDGAQVVTVAAAAAFTVATAGAPAFGAIMAGGGTAIQYAALGAAFASQAYAASATGGGNNGIVAAAINTLSLAATAGSSSLFSGYVSWTPHRPDNLLTGEREVDGGWGGGVNVAVKGSESLSGYMFNGGLSFQPGSGVGINLNVSFPGSTGMPPGTFLGINYEAGSGNYTASGGFNIYGDAGLSISAGKDGYASFGLNYNKDGKGWLNNLSGVGLTMGSDGVFTLSHQFKGSDTLNLSYNTNTHGFSPIGVNGNFINDLNLSLIQENAAKGNADAIKKLADYYGNVLVERGVISAEKMGELMTKSGGQEELISLYDSNKQTAFANGENSPEAIKWKSETTQAVEQLRSEGLNITMGGQSQSGGFFNDLFTSFQNSMGNATNGNGGFDTNGAFSINTCFTAGTLVHTKNGLKKIEEIGIGDQVLSWDEESGEQNYNRVSATFVRDAEEIYTLVFADGKQVETTWNHPFRRLLPEYKSETSPTKANSEWVDAKDLKVGDLTFTKDGRVLEIGFIHTEERDEKVYNFTVESDHDYFVGEVGILVHNVDYGSDGTLSNVSTYLDANPISTFKDWFNVSILGNKPTNFNEMMAYMKSGSADARMEAVKWLNTNSPAPGSLEYAEWSMYAHHTGGQRMTDTMFNEQLKVLKEKSSTMYEAQRAADGTFALTPYERESLRLFFGKEVDTVNFNTSGIVNSIGNLITGGSSSAFTMGDTIYLTSGDKRYENIDDRMGVIAHELFHNRQIQTLGLSGMADRQLADMEHAKSILGVHYSKNSLYDGTLPEDINTEIKTLSTSKLMEISTAGTYKGYRVYVEQLASLFEKKAVEEMMKKVGP